MISAGVAIGMAGAFAAGRILERSAAWGSIDRCRDVRRDGRGPCDLGPMCQLRAGTAGEPGRCLAGAARGIAAPAR